jgi:hypothetical protein
VGVVVLVVLGTSSEFLVVHVPQLHCLDGVVGVKGIRHPMVTIVVSTSCYLYFVSYALSLAAFCAISLHG